MPLKLITEDNGRYKQEQTTSIFKFFLKELLFSVLEFFQVLPIDFLSFFFDAGLLANVQNISDISRTKIMKLGTNRNFTC